MSDKLHCVTKFIRNYFEGQKGIIPLHEPCFMGNERSYVMEALDSNIVSSVGKFVDKFEDDIKNYTHAQYAVATVNGTSALHMCLLLAGVKQNDLVITQSLSFVATCNAISYIGAQPLFIDIEKETLGISPEALSVYLRQYAIIRGNECFHKVTQQKISACVPMHTFGHPARIDLLLDVCNQYNIPLIEDAAESIGSTYSGKHTGTFGLLGAFSFNGNKTITCGGGGMIVTNNYQLSKMGKHLTTQAKVPHRWNFDHDQIGYNYRMPNINAALACAQLEQLETFIARKRVLAADYQNFFKSTPYTFFHEPAAARSNYWLNAVLTDSRKERDALLEYTNNLEVMTRPAWTLMHKLPMFNLSMRDELLNSEWVEERLVNLPSSVNYGSA